MRRVGVGSNYEHDMILHMEPQTNRLESVIAPLKKVTPLSKYLAMVLFIILPFLGGWIGYTLAPEKIVENVTTAPATVSTEINNYRPGDSIERNDTVVEDNREEGEINYLLATKYKPPVEEANYGMGSIVLIGSGNELELHSQPVNDKRGCIALESPISDFLYEKLSSLIKQRSNIINHASCSFAGSGVKVVLYNDSGNLKVVRLRAESCENVSGCDPYGEPEIIWQE